MMFAAKSAVGSAVIWPSAGSSRPSPTRNPTARSSSWPGVRIVTATRSPATRISSGSSRAMASGKRRSPRRLLGDRADVDGDDLVLRARGVDVARLPDQQVGPRLGEVERGEDVAGLDAVGEECLQLDAPDAAAHGDHVA